MLLKDFKIKLIKIIEGGDKFIVNTNKDEYFSFLKDDTILVVGKDHTEMFLVYIQKVV
jgi:hypothetical protein